MKKFFAEFKKFISRGNVLDMAVGVIIGGAFTAIVTALTDGILKPLINFLISLIMGGEDASSIYTMLKTVNDANGNIDLAASIYINWGALISAIINFVLVAFILFCIIKAINAAKDATELNNVLEKRIARKNAAGKPLNKKEQAYVDAKVAAAKAAEDAAKAAEEEANKLSTTDALLADIKALLEKK